jgi:hypothetical protein
MPKKQANHGSLPKQTKKPRIWQVIRRVIHSFGGQVFSCLRRNSMHIAEESYKLSI